MIRDIELTEGQGGLLPLAPRVSARVIDPPQAPFERNFFEPSIP
jgi:hypothetical protein